MPTFKALSAPGHAGLILTLLGTLVLATACAPGQMPPPPGQACIQDGKTYQPGETFPSSDGCNSCSCTLGGQVVCTLKACVDAGAGCFYGGKAYAVGDSFPSTDGCNTCSCGAGGSVGCTKKACPPQAACQRTGCSGHVCAAEPAITTCEFRPEYACYKAAACVRQADGKCGFTKTPELERCLAAAK